MCLRSRCFGCRSRSFHATGGGTGLCGTRQGLDDIHDGSNTLKDLYGTVYHAREGLPRIAATFKGVGHRRNATGYTFRIAPQVSQMHIALAQHLFILSIRADEFFNLAALTFIKRILRVAKHIL